MEGYAAIDSVAFDYDTNEKCETLPPEADTRPDTTPTPTTTHAPTNTFPNCNFNSNECGWVIDSFSSMKWMITDVNDLTDMGYDAPKYDYDQRFLYVSARDGNASDKTTLSTEMKSETVSGCLKFHFNIFVSCVTKGVLLIFLCSIMEESNH